MNTLQQETMTFEDYIQFHKQAYTNYKIQLDELKTIMQKKLLNTYYQPILDMKECEIVGFEALNRPASAIFNNVDAFYDFIGTSRQVFAFEALCRNLSIQRFHERLSNEGKDIKIDRALIQNIDTEMPQQQLLLTKLYYNSIFTISFLKIK